MTDGSPALSFPRLQARSLRFTLGVPRNLRVSPDGERIVFVRTPDGTTRTGSLWTYDVPARAERCVAEPGALLGGGDEELSGEERARRERSREAATGIVGYATDRDVRVASFALSGKVWVCDLATGTSRALPSVGSAIDPRVDPTGQHVAYAAGGALHVIESDGTLERTLASEDAGDGEDVGDGKDVGDGEEVVWGQAEFVAAEEMERYRGYWWAPDGSSLLVERYDNSPVSVWHVADPADPAAEPVRQRYPAAGTCDADVTLWHVALDGTRTEIAWDRRTFPYLTRVSWAEGTPPLVQVMTRDQRRAQALAVDIASGATRVVREQHDPMWVDLVGGVPAYAPGGALVTCEDVDDCKRVLVDGEPLSPADLQVRAVLDVGQDGLLVSASHEPTETHLVRVAYDGTVTALSEDDGVHGGTAGGGTTVVSRSSLETTTTQVTVRRNRTHVGTLVSHQVEPGFVPRVLVMRAGARDIRTAVVFPRGHVPGSEQLPVLMDPYGGPHAQRVVASARAFLEPQWLADQGFCVVVADGRGTPGRGRAWDRAVRDDLAGVTLQDQVDALAAVAQAYPEDVDTTRVGITGWSYGGYLSALAVLRRPDVFHAAVAGAPVTEWRLYDTFYTERYLGHPQEQPEVYDANSLVKLTETDAPARPLLIIHGMVDDNVVVAHSLRLSSALLAAGRPHSVLPLTGVTHMTSQEVVAENLKALQVDFLQRSLRSSHPRSGPDLQ